MIENIFSDLEKQFSDILLMLTSSGIATTFILFIATSIAVIIIALFAVKKMAVISGWVHSQFSGAGSSKLTKVLAHEFGKVFKDIAVVIISSLRTFRYLFAIQNYPNYLQALLCYLAAIDVNAVKQCKGKTKMLLPTIGLSLFVAIPIVFLTYYMALTGTTPDSFRDKLLLDFLGRTQSQNDLTLLQLIHNDGFAVGVAMFVSIIYATNILLIDRAFIASSGSIFDATLKIQEQASTWLKLLFRLSLVVLTGVLASLSLELAINEVSITTHYLTAKIKSYDAEISNINTSLSGDINPMVATIDSVYCSSEVKGYKVAEEDVEKSFSYNIRLRGSKTIAAEKNMQIKNIGLLACRDLNKEKYRQVEVQKNSYLERLNNALENRKLATRLLQYIKGEIKISAFTKPELVLPQITISEKRQILDDIKSSNPAFNRFSLLVVLALMMIEVMPLLLKWVMSRQIAEYEEKC